jgi:hypothetical protein
MVQGGFISAAAVLMAILAAAVPAAGQTLLIRWCYRRGYNRSYSRGRSRSRRPRSLRGVPYLAGGAALALTLCLMAKTVYAAPAVVSLPAQMQDLLQTGAKAPIIEEGSKALALLFLSALARYRCQDAVTGALRGALMGIGFSMVENGMYFLLVPFAAGSSGWLQVVFLRGIVFGLCHAFYAALTGAGLGLTRRLAGDWRRWLLPLVALAAAVAFHSAHNVSVWLAGATGAASLLASFVGQVGGATAFAVMLLPGYRRGRASRALQSGAEPEPHSAIEPLDRHRRLLGHEQRNALLQEC